MKLELSNLDQLIEDGYITKRKHPTEDLYIYKYTAMAQYSKMWNPTTMACRGLILDSDNNVIARPLTKFFNIEEHVGNLPDGKFKVYDKLDGSLAILYWVNDKPFIASCGSFTSPQAQKGTELIQKVSNLEVFNRKYTYCFELLYPENRIVCDYGDKEALVFLTAIDNETGLDVDVDLPPEIERAYHFSGADDLSRLRDDNDPNREGYVIKWDNGFRLKAKYETYVRLHRIITNCTSYDIWEMMAISNVRQIYSDHKEIAKRLKMDLARVQEMVRCKDPFAELLDRVPDEFYEWVQSTISDINFHYAQIYNHCLDISKHIQSNYTNRKDIADYIFSNGYGEYSSILFNMIDEKPFSAAIWLKVYPKYEKPFSNFE